MISKILNDHADYIDSIEEYRVTPHGTTTHDLRALSEKIEKCSGYYVSKMDRRNRSSMQIVERHSCNQHKICPKCADSEYMRRMRSLNAWYIANREQVDSCYFLTLTQPKKPNESASDAARRILASWRKFQRIGQKTRGGEYEKIIAGLRSVEIEPTENGYHAHIHAIVFCSSQLDYQMYVPAYRQKIMSLYHRYLDKTELREACERNNLYLHPDHHSKITREWSQTGEPEIVNSGCDCDVIFTRWKKPKTLFDRLDGKTGRLSEVAAKIRYATKYSVKNGEFDKIPAGGMLELIDAFRSVRKNEYIGGVGKYDKSTVQDEIDPAFSLYQVNDEGREIHEISLREKVGREILPNVLHDRRVRQISEVHKWTARRRSLLQLIRQFGHVYGIRKLYCEIVEKLRRDMRQNITEIIGEYKKTIDEYIKTFADKIGFCSRREPNTFGFMAGDLPVYDVLRPFRPKRFASWLLRFRVLPPEPAAGLDIS